MSTRLRRSIYHSNDIEAWKEYLVDNIKELTAKDIYIIRHHPDLFEIFLENINSENRDRCAYIMSELLCELILHESNDAELDFILTHCRQMVEEEWHGNIFNTICEFGNYRLYLKYIEQYSYVLKKYNCMTHPIVRCYNLINCENVNLDNIILHYMENYMDRTNENNIRILMKLIKNIPITKYVFWEVYNFLPHTSEILAEIFCSKISSLTVEIAEKMIRDGMDVNAIFDEVRLIQYTCSTDPDRMNLFQTLEDYGAQVDLSVVAQALMCCNIKLVEYIRANYDIDINAFRKFGTILQEMIHREIDPDIIAYLIDQPDVNLEVIDSNHGFTILHTIYDRSLYKSDRWIVTKLLNRGVDPYTRDVYGMCFFHYSKHYHDIKILDEYGLDLSIDPLDSNNLRKFRSLLFFPFQFPETKHRTIRFINLCRIIFKHFPIDYTNVSKINMYLEKMYFSNSQLNSEIIVHTHDFVFKFGSYAELENIKKRLTIIRNNFQIDFSEKIMSFIENRQR